MNREIVMGLEVHAELSTLSKIFCGCSTAFGGAPNSRVCPVCAGMPGTLPVLNRMAVEYALRVGLALDCTITRHSVFDRKNYFYPDLPKAYQVSQLYAPICRDGRVDIETADGSKTIGIREIHMEEDAGKLVHDACGGGTFMDFNRCGVPLLEIVTHPDFRHADEVSAFLARLRETLLFLGVCDGRMQEGSLRVDVNLSVRSKDGALGVRTETKNLNSFKAIGRAIAYEAARQTDVLESGGTVVQETRRWDDESGVSYAMRSKENAHDYRYFPEPDLLPIDIDDALLGRVKAELPELAHQKRARYEQELGLSAAQATILTGEKGLSDLFEDIVRHGAQPVEAAHLITGEILRLMNQTNRQSADLSLETAGLARLIGLVSSGVINRSAYKETVGAMFWDNADPEAYIAEKGLRMVSGEGVAAAVDEVLRDFPEAVADYRAGKGKAFGFLMGQVMKKLGGSGNPKQVKALLIDKL